MTNKVHNSIGGNCMIKGLISGLILGGCVALAHFVHKDDYKYEHKARVFIGLVYAALSTFWLLSLIFLVSGTSAKDTFFSVIVVIAVPIILLLWIYKTRRRITRCMMALRQKIETNQPWSCPRCSIQVSGNQCTKCGYVPFGAENKQKHILSLDTAPEKDSEDT